MRQGAAISAAVHGGLLALATFGGLFSVEPLETELSISEVSLLSESEMASLGLPEAMIQPESMEAPPVFDQSPQFDVPSVEMPSIEVPLLPDEPSAILEEAPPPASLQSPALPGIPEFISPNLESFMEAVIDIPEQPPEVDFAPPPSERVDAAPAPQPEPEVTIAETEQEEIVPSEDAEPDLPAIEQEATARIEASTRIVTEAEEEPQALFSVAPLLRPANLETASREAEDVSPTEPEPPQEPSESEQIRSAILQDKRDLENPGSSGGDENTADRPLNVSDIEGLNRAIQPCWNFGALSSEAARVVVTISIRLDLEGKPIKNGTKLVEASRSSDAAQRQAYEVAIRAVNQCLSDGYDFPPEKYEQWKQIELTFNPERMRLK